MNSLNWADFTVLGIIFISIVVSLMRGFVKEAISLTSWILAAGLAIHFSQPFSALITFTEVDSIRLILAFLLIFVSTVFIGAIANYAVSKVVSKTPFSIPDRILGMFFGAFRGVLVVSLIVLFSGLTPFPQDQWWQDSQFVPKLEKVAVWIQAHLPEDIAQHFEFDENNNENESEVAVVISPPQYKIVD